VKAHYVSRSILFKPENLELKLKKFYNFNEKNLMNHRILKSIYAELSSRETVYWKYIDDFRKMNNIWFNMGSIKEINCR
jgi:hypothetical protein